MFTKFVNFFGPRLARCFTQGPQKPGRCYTEIIESKCDPGDKNFCKGFSLKTTDTSYIHLPKDTMWEFPEWHGNICERMPVRMDELYYKASNLKTRKYKQTWATVPSLRTEICEIYPAICRASPMPTRSTRVRKSKPGCYPRNMEGLMPCKLMAKPIRNMCPKHSRDCRTAYRKWKPPSKGKKENTPYPCYSECKHSGHVPPTTDECKCLDRRAMCEVEERIRRQKTFAPEGFNQMPKQRHLEIASSGSLHSTLIPSHIDKEYYP
ncbi:hypothetical protein GQX74_000231 [Glossina fuscipes]|nr:hypothetical protein GQX74_000231 [Glossina fuscipes]